MSNFYAALEIGTTRTVLAIGETETGGRLKITCHAEIPSTGVRKSQILDINQATSSIKSVLSAIEKKQLEAGSKITLGNAYLVVSGQHIKAGPFQGMVPIEGAKVGTEELDAVFMSSRTMQIPKDREFLDIVGYTKGRGFQGVVKRYNFGGGRGSHGGAWTRRTGSIGCCEWPGRVNKGKRMPGHMGNTRCTVQNLQIVKVMPEDNVLLVKGAVPGAKGGILLLSGALKKPAAK